MNDEIKEILNIINYKYKDYYVQDIVSGDDLKLLSDYITNLQEKNEDLKDRLKVMEHFKNSLQEENKMLKELCDKYEEEHSNEFKIWKNERHQILDYKSRCEKAIKYINTKEIYYGEISKYDAFNKDEIGIELLIILNGGDE